MNTQILMRAIVESVVFVGLSGDGIIKPDAAVGYLEQIASILKELSDSERRIFENYVISMAQAEQRTSGRTDRVDFLFALCGNLGLKE